MDSTLKTQIEFAREDLRKRVGDDVTIRVIEAGGVTWRTSAMGCPKPDRAYRMVLTPGVRIRLEAGGVEYAYHASTKGTPFLCEHPGQVETPAPGSNYDKT